MREGRGGFRDALPPGSAAALAGLVLALGGALLLGVPLGLPLDDAWIHAAFARHLAEGAGWTLFLQGGGDGGESSPLWPLLLAVGERAGLGAPRTALLLGAVSWLLLPAAAGSLASTPKRGRAVAVAVGLCGPLLFLALSGMENLPALTLGVAALAAFGAGRPRRAALLAGGGALLRPEGLLLVLLLILAGVDARRAEGWRRRRAVLPALGDALGGLAVAAAGLGLLALLEGHVPPSTLAGRRWLLGLPPTPTLDSLGSGTAAFLADWLHALGGDLGLGRWIHDHPFAGAAFLRWLWKLAAACALVLGLVEVLRRAGGAASRSGARLLLVWTLWALLFFALVLPVRGHAGRYQPQVYVLAVVLAVEGVAVLRSRRGRTGTGGLLAGILLAAFLAGHLVEAAGLWRSAVDHLQRVHLRAAADLEALRRRRPLPPVAVFDVGAVAWLYRGPVVDLSGLSDGAVARALAAAEQGAVRRLLEERGCGLLLLPVWGPDRPDALLARLGLRGGAGPPLRHWESPRSEWGPAFHFAGHAFPALDLRPWDGAP